MNKKEQELVERFTKLDQEASLRKVEEAIREDIALGSPELKSLFDQHWIKVTGGSYYQPITMISPQSSRDAALPGRIYPKASNYLTERVFTEIWWKKHTAERGKGLDKETLIRFELGGKHTQGRQRVIHHKCKPHRLASMLGEKLAQQILEESKKATKGVIKDLNQPIMVEGYWEVIFAAKGSPSDKEDVELQWEGDCLQIMRQKPVVLPGHYIENADNGFYYKYLQLPDQPRKIEAIVYHFPYTVLREATREEFLKMKAAGDKKTKEDRERLMNVSS